MSVQKLSAIRFDPRACVAEAIRLCGAGEGQPCLIACDIRADVPALVVGDPQHLRQLVGQLVEQAVPVAPTTPVVLRVELEAVTSDTVWLHFSVNDANPTSHPDGQPQVPEGLGDHFWWDPLPGQGTVAHLRLRFDWPHDADHVPLFDARATLDRVGADGTLLREAIALFRRGCAEQLGQLRAALESGDPVRWRRAGHALRGLLLFFGAGTTATSLAELLRCGVAGDGREAELAFAALHARLQTLQETLLTFAEETFP